MALTPLQPRPAPPNTLRVPLNGLVDPKADTTDFEISQSTILPAIRQFMPDDRFEEPPLQTTAAAAKLDADTHAVFHQRLRLCAITAAVPFLFFFASSVFGYIGLFSRAVVGIPGAILSGGVLVALIVLWGVLWRIKQLSETSLRAIEIAMFGVMSLYFAYLQFALLTSEQLRLLDRTNDDQIILKPNQPTIVPADREKFVVSLPTQEEITYIRRLEQNGVLAAALVVHFNWFVVIVFHGVLVPNSLIRGVGVVGGMVGVAVVIDIIALVLSDPIIRHKWVLMTVAVTVLTAGGLLSIFGTAKTAALREEVQSAKQTIREMGQYRLRRKLGQGGMGEVYLAEHHLLKRPCALKRIHAKYIHSDEQLKRFEREVQTTARLRHPNTVEIYDYGRADDGAFYYVMEYIPGLSLEDMVTRFGPMPPERAVHIMRQVTGALREAHKLGLVHRDLKPSNVMVCRDGGPYDYTKLLDFGLVQLLAWETAPTERITRDGLIVGTPEYMSPEQAQGMSLDPRSDLFSLGSVMYYLVTGKEVFHRENAMKTLLAVVNEEPVGLLHVNPYLPADVAAVIAKCLAKPLSQRFENAAELETALAACQCASRWTEPRALAWWDNLPDQEHGTGTDLNSLPIKT